ADCRSMCPPTPVPPPYLCPSGQGRRFSRSLCRPPSFCGWMVSVHSPGSEQSRGHISEGGDDEGGYLGEAEELTSLSNGLRDLLDRLDVRLRHDRSRIERSQYELQQERVRFSSSLQQLRQQREDLQQEKDRVQLERDRAQQERDRAQQEAERTSRARELLEQEREGLRTAVQDIAREQERRRLTEAAAAPPPPPAPPEAVPKAPPPAPTEPMPRAGGRRGRPGLRRSSAVLGGFEVWKFSRLEVV
ncbi:unnamed protein product, partial [Prorocentrum cordatum]